MESFFFIRKKDNEVSTFGFMTPVQSMIQYKQKENPIHSLLQGWNRAKALTFTAISQNYFSNENPIATIYHTLSGEINTKNDDSNTDNQPTSLKEQNQRFKVVVIGGGSAGINITSQLFRQSAKFKKDDILIIEPSKVHLYKPMWTLIGGGLKKYSSSVREMSSVIPKKAKWLQEAANDIDPDKQIVTTDKGKNVRYDYLVIVPGMQLNWDKIKGLEEGLKQQNGICSNYHPEFVAKTYDQFMQKIQELKKDSQKTFNFYFTFPTTPIQCGGAPLKIMFLIDDYLRSHGVRDRANIQYFTPGAAIFGQPHYAKLLEGIRREKDIGLNTGYILREIKPRDKVAIFEEKSTGNMIEKAFDFIHAPPEVSGPDFLKKNPKISNEQGFVKVNRNTTQHVNYANIFSCGDVSDIPTSKTLAAITRQAPVLVDNLISHMETSKMASQYNGYTSCPITVDRKRILMAEFKFDGQLARTFHGTFINQDRPARLFMFIKQSVFPQAYWNGVMQGRWYGPTLFWRRSEKYKESELSAS